MKTQQGRVRWWQVTINKERKMEMTSKKNLIGSGLVAAGLALLLSSTGMATGYGASSPTAPAGILVTKLSASKLGVTWAPPSSNGGSDITAYNVSSNVGGASCSTTGALACSISGLKAGSYIFSVTATNSVGTSQATVANAFNLKTGASIDNGIVSFSAVGSKSIATKGFLTEVAKDVKSVLKPLKLTALKKAPTLSSTKLKVGANVTVAFYNATNKTATLTLTQGTKTVKIGKAKSFGDAKSVTVATFKVAKGLKLGKANLIISGLSKKAISVKVTIVK
ncbi:MAG: fibronectin type III domain-containing protein [Actinobacteria bacterium]|nr:fibronectin type III domain-containing protein [Actinomycetota bacterium]